MTFRFARSILAGLALAALPAAGALAQTPVTVVLPNPSALNVFPLHVAIGEGYFAEEGLDVSVEAVNGSASVLQTLASGTGQIGQPGPGPVLAARSRGEDVVFLYNLYPKTGFGVVVREESAVQTPADLKGATIGVGTADGAEVGFTRNILTDAGLTEGTDYEFLTVGDGGTAAAAFLNDEVEAYAAAAVDMVIIESRGIPLREITPDEYLGYFANGFAATRAYIDANPEVIKGFGRAIVRGYKFGTDPANIDKVLEHAAAANPQEAEDRDFALGVYEAVSQRMTSVDPSRPLGYQPPEDWEKWHESVVATGTIPAPLDDLEAAYTNEFVEYWNQD
ncbi:ABC transporter substrate-binding protein [Amaricoccus sp.]|uniref:ABC transporter substrate-binding protein n=1 Tax=Amaricoccus sp. TaxID=1872485 RepID=UPI002618F183|nr:ABC transporter substrate-binding protein [Amaricoccus sp.]HRO10672.1 ABC transporter substrate-binding protein [Amaricoccus sp.]